jgi:hypothetical protein
MRMHRNIYFLFAFVLLAVAGCVEPYTPPASKAIPDILVVDGFLNSTDGSVNVSLSKALALTDPSAPPPVENATIYLEDSDDNRLELNYQTNGKYSLEGVAVDNSLQYRLHIITQSNKEYVSEFITLKPTPEIDSITWAAKDDGVEIRANTHDNTGNSRYYLWSFEETWQYRPAFPSYLITEFGNVRSRKPEEEIYNCWQTLSSTKVLLGSSTRLSEDIISQTPIHFIPKGSEKISVYYSILVSQTAVSESTYDFYEKLRKTTEDLGSLFDPQPGRVLGNIHSATDDGETVLGIFNGGEVKQQRIFISYYDLPRSFHIPQQFECYLDSLDLVDLPFFNEDSYNLVGAITQGPAVVGYTYSTNPCTDCRVRGGVNTKPSFWP